VTQFSSRARDLSASWPPQRPGPSARAPCTVTDLSDFRLGLAATMGFTTERGDAPTDERFDVLLECSGAPGVLAGGMRRLLPGGRAAMIGMSKEEAIGLPLSQLNVNELTLAPGQPLQPHLAACHPVGLLGSGRREALDHAPLPLGGSR